MFLSLIDFVVHLFSSIFPKTYWRSATSILRIALLPSSNKSSSFLSLFSRIATAINWTLVWISSLIPPVSLPPARQTASQAACLFRSACSKARAQRKKGKTLAQSKASQPASQSIPKPRTSLLPILLYSSPPQLRSSSQMYLRPPSTSLLYGSYCYFKCRTRHVNTTGKQAGGLSQTGAREIDSGVGEGKIRGE